MAYEIVWTENAKEDLELIYDYLVRKWSERVAEKFLVKVLARLELI
ncbi:MAG: type II toxin-antitoxin system RelE/ParE family toxin [Chitinophagales bacterium]|nr:type II toxin-antitoxin system RelE/ParE family toxin [Chitinophagales bacterium]